MQARKPEKRQSELLSKTILKQFFVIHQNDKFSHELLFQDSLPTKKLLQQIAQNDSVHEISHKISLWR